MACADITRRGVRCDTHFPRAKRRHPAASATRSETTQPASSITHTTVDTYHAKYTTPTAKSPSLSPLSHAIATITRPTGTSSASQVPAATTPVAIDASPPKDSLLAHGCVFLCCAFSFDDSGRLRRRVGLARTSMNRKVKNRSIVASNLPTGQLGTGTCSRAVRRAAAPSRSAIARASSSSCAWSGRPSAARARAWSASATARS
jgi:hypothetical protein